jgi:hypothetical protein
MAGGRSATLPTGGTHTGTNAKRFPGVPEDSEPDSRAYGSHDKI